MIMAGQEYRKDIPFKNVYLTGIVRDKLGRKMSKSLGNSPDPIQLIEQYGADGVRVGMLLTSPAGNDLPFDESLCEQGRNFSNKVWNAFRLVNGWEVDKNLKQPMYAALSVTWFRSRFNEALTEINEHYTKYRLSDALMGVYKLVWDDFCSWFLEMIKPAYQQPIDAATHKAAVSLLSDIMQVLHPFMPFITEEIWHLLHGEKAGSIMISQMPVPQRFDEKILTHFTYTLEIVTSVRSVRKDKNIPIKDKLELFILKPGKEIPNLLFDSLIEKLCNLSPIRYVTEKVNGAASFLIKGNEFYIPLGDKIDTEAEIEKLNQELEYTRGFLKSVMVKLSNERFVANAKPEVVEVERRKMADAETKIKTIEEQISMLKK
jgi:valyl-tRNA synthetase